MIIFLFFFFLTRYSQHCEPESGHRTEPLYFQSTLDNHYSYLSEIVKIFRDTVPGWQLGQHTAQ